MYQFSDYFDSKILEQPYTSAGEELEDYLRLLDMILESYLEFKGLKSKSRLFSRGLVITEAEMIAYFDMPPYFRERDIWDPVLSAGVDAAFDYIDHRVGITAGEGKPELLRVRNLRETFELSRTELIAVLLTLAAEIDRRYERIYGFLQDDISKGAPTLGLLNALMGRITPREGAEETVPMPLREQMYTYFFIRKADDGRLSSALTLLPLMKKLLMGIPEKEETGPGVFRLYEEKEEIPVFFTDSYREISEAEDLHHEQSGRLVYLANEDAETVLHVLYKFCSGQGEKLFILDYRQLLGMEQEKQRVTLSEMYLRLKMTGGRLAIRFIPESDAAPVRPQESENPILPDEIFRAHAPKTIFIFGQKEEPGELAAEFVPLLRIPDAPVTLRTEIWQYFMTAEEGISVAPDVSIPDLADCYEIPYGKVRKVIGHAVATAKIRREPIIDRSLILDSLRQMNQVDFSGLATFVNPSYSWDDITITAPQKEIMKTACDRYRLRNRVGEGWGLKRKNAYGNGVSILLYGPPGTGKTMAAQVIANELALPMYRVDISQISSKYIGETEKNLAVIFNAAAKANVILFFDEADALFSKRTDVGDSHDKYANNETSYLLQKIEEYNGMSILATNYYNNFDNAFVRRITYAIHMESPDKTTRYSLWTTILPETAEKDPNIDFKFLADKFELSGSNIKAILFNAAYMAGADQTVIGMKHIVRAMEYEFTKLGKLVNESDFEPYDIYLQSGGRKKDPAKKSGK